MSKQTTQLLSMRAYAKRRGCDIAAVSRQVSSGRVTLVDGKIDPVTADRQWAATTRERVDFPRAKNESKNDDTAGASDHGAGVARLPPPEANGKSREADEDYGQARCRHEIAEADKAEIELAQLQGLLINRAGVEMAMETAFRQIRDTILSTPDRLPIDGAHRTMFRNALRETLSDALKMLPSMMAGETAQ